MIFKDKFAFYLFINLLFFQYGNVFRGRSRLCSILLLISIAFRTVHTDAETALLQEMEMKAGNHSIARAIEIQNILENSIVKTFNKFFNEFKNSSSVYKQSIIYMCDQSCTHKNAYEYGLSSAFLLSVLSDRKFSVLSARVFDLYEERGYKWKVNLPEILNKPGGMIFSPAANQIRAMTDLHILEADLQKKNFAEAFDRDFMTLTGNRNWIQDLRRNRHCYEKMPWLFKMHACDVNRLLHFGLFRIPQSIKTVLHSHLIKKIGTDRLICFNGQANADLSTNGVLDFIIANYNHSAYKIYRVNKASKERPENDNNAESDKHSDDVHIDFDNLYEEAKVGEESAEKLKAFINIVDIYVLSLCNVLITAESPTGILATHLRRDSGGLFCLRNGLVFPCTRELIAGSFRDQENVPVHLDQRYYMLKRNVGKYL